MPKKTIDRFEWDFDSCPEDQLELCFEYERARNSLPQQEIKECEVWRRSFPGSTFDDYWKHVVADGRNAESALFLYPEFPLKPYLSIPEQERNRRFALIRARGVEPVCAEDEGLSKEFRDKHGSKDLRWFEQGIYDLQSDFGFDLSASAGVGRKGVKYEIKCNAIKCPDMNATFAVFRFDWGDCSDQVFIDALKAWLNKNRPKNVKIRESRGGGSEPRQFRSSLNQLGAWRLLNFPMHWKTAADHTQATRKNHKSLYSEEPAWIRARNRADWFLSRLNR